MAQIHIPFSREMAVAVMEGNKVATTPQPQQELIDHMKQHMKNMVGEYPDQYHEILCAGMLAHIDALSRPASTPTLPRDAVLRFSRIMETKLCEKDSIRDGWEDCDPVWLFERAEDEMGELKKEIAAYMNHSSLSPKWLTIKERVQREAADVANFCMMISDNMDSPRNPEAQK